MVARDMTSDSQQPFYLDGHRVDPELGTVGRDGIDIHVEPKVMAVLAYLARRPDRLVRRNELFDVLWQGSVVHDMALTRCVTQIRKIFCDTRPHRIIETIPKKGYRFVAAVVEQDAFEQSALDRSQKGRSEGAVRWLAAIAAILVVAVLVVSTASQSNIEALSAANKTPTIDSETTQPDDSASVYYRRASALAENRTREDVNESIGLFKRAIQERPDFALAHSGLSNALSLQAFYWGEPTLDEAEKHADRAVELNPLSAESFNARGLVYAIHGRSEDSIVAVERALALKPDYWQAAHNLGNVYYDTHHLDLAAHWYARAADLRPENASALAHLGEIYLKLGDLEEAERRLDRAWELQPDNRIVIRAVANLRLIQGDYAGVIESCDRLLERQNNDLACLQYSALAAFMAEDVDQARNYVTQMEELAPDHLYAALIRAQTELYAGDPELAEEILVDIETRAQQAIDEHGNRWYLSWSLAAVQSLRGNTDQAIQWLDETLKSGRVYWLWDDNDPALAPLRDDPRFRRYLEAMRAKNSATRGNLREAT